MMYKLLTFIIVFSCTLNIVAQKEISIEDIFEKGTFRTKNVPGFRFMNDGLHYTKLEENAVKKYNFKTGEYKETLLSGPQVSDDFNIQEYNFSENEEKIIVRSNTERIFRRSYKATYVVFDRLSGKTIPVKDLEKVRYATLNSTMDKIAFVQNNDLFFEDLKTGIVVQVTTDGEKNKIINGTTDWVYEEEFGFVKGFEWSPDGDRLAYLRFDESAVKEFTMTLYQNEDYPIYETFKYPKVGAANSIVSAHVYDINTQRTTDAQLDKTEEFYIPRIKWSPNNDQLIVFKMNRHQNHLQLMKMNAINGVSEVMLDETNKYYIDIHDNLTFTKDGKCFIWLSEKDGNNHVYLYSIKGKLKRQVTSGNWEVTSFYGYDEKTDQIYYQSTEGSSMERYVYSIGVNGRNKRKLTVNKGVNRVQFSSTYAYYMHSHSSATQPPSFEVKTNNGQMVRSLEDNKELSTILTEYGVSKTELMSLNTEPGVDLNTAIIKPANFDPNKKYPLFMYLYGGPGNQQVMNSWNSFRYYSWFQKLTQMGYIVAVVDNRGTGGKGEEFKKMTYLQMGKYETIDQINAAKKLGDLAYVDADRIGIFGWSYGGYMSSLCLLKGPEIFKAAMAVAPVTNWKWYDSIYTERYMRTTEENPEGYHDNSPVNFAENLEGKYLLIHGMGDDNVHFQNSVEMANALIKAKKQFDTYYYPNRNHSIYGDNARFHLFTKLTDFIRENI